MTRDKTIMVKVSIDEKELIVRYAKANGTGASSLMRMLAMEYIRKENGE